MLLFGLKISQRLLKQPEFTYWGTFFAYETFQGAQQKIREMNKFYHYGKNVWIVCIM